MKTFELTQEQINQLAEKKHAKELLQQFIPEAFETKLEVGKWYKVYFNEGYCLFNFQEYSETPSKNYGFTNTKMPDYGWSEVGISVYKIDENIPATEEEVREALINEAKKRGFNNIGNLKIKNTFGGISNRFVTLTNNFYYDHKGNTLRLDGALIFNNGVWAEIIEEPEPTKEEINRELTFLKNQNEQ